MKAFALILLKWSCIALNLLFWSYPITIGRTCLHQLIESKFNYYSEIEALIGATLMIVIGVAICINSFKGFVGYAFALILVIGHILPYIFPSQVFLIPRPIFDKYLLIDSKNETWDSGIIQAGCYEKAKLLDELVRDINLFCDDCLNKSDVKLLIRKDCFYSYRFAEFRGLSEFPGYPCSKDSLSESSFIEKVIFPLRIACEQTFFRFLFLLCFICIPFSLFEFKNSNFWMTFGQPLTPLEYNRLFRLSGALLALILIFNYMYLLELKG